VDDEYVEGLTGEEIINDLLAQVAEKLRGDCNLREMDAYPGGYEGTVKIHLKLHALDTAEIKAEIPVSAPAEKDFPAAGDPAIVDTEAETEVDIELEPRLNVVRERSGQDVPTLSKDENGAVVVKKRHYARKQR
jgi:hypothetical protein